MRDRFSIPHGMRGRRALTLVELLIVVVVLAIGFGLAIPSLLDARMLRLREAARMLAADFEYAQSASIAHPEDPRLVKFDLEAGSYWVAATSAPDAPVADPSDGRPLMTLFGTGRATATAGVTLENAQVGGDRLLRFDAYGSPDQATDATVTLAIAGQAMTVRVQAGTGDVRID